MNYSIQSGGCQGKKKAIDFVSHETWFSPSGICTRASAHRKNTKIFRKSKLPSFSDVFFCGIITVKYRVSHETLCFTGFDVRIWRVDDKKEQHI
jgi:hypothetical protein